MNKNKNLRTHEGRRGHHRLRLGTQVSGSPDTDASCLLRRQKLEATPSGVSRATGNGSTDTSVPSTQPPASPAPPPPGASAAQQLPQLRPAPRAPSLTKSQARTSTRPRLPGGAGCYSQVRGRARLGPAPVRPSGPLRSRAGASRAGPQPPSHLAEPAPARCALWWRCCRYRGAGGGTGRRAAGHGVAARGQPLLAPQVRSVSSPRPWLWPGQPQDAPLRDTLCRWLQLLGRSLGLGRFPAVGGAGAHLEPGRVRSPGCPEPRAGSCEMGCVGPGRASQAPSGAKLPSEAQQSRGFKKERAPVWKF